MKKIAILQSNYIPWKGYFDLIASVDEFVLYDDMQYTRRDWRNRNQIKTPQGVQWLTVPVVVKGKYHQKIRETEIDGTSWAQAHWKTLSQNYRRAPHFDEVASWLEPLYLNTHQTHISALNLQFIEAICQFLKIGTRIRSSSEFYLNEGKTERLAGICQQAGAQVYVSGPSAREYMDETVFQQMGMGVSWYDYTGYGEYPQLWGPFTHHVTILDLLFNCGREARHHMRYVQP